MKQLLRSIYRKLPLPLAILARNLYNIHTRLWGHRIGKLEGIAYQQLKLCYITGRLDVRFLRMEVLLYYANPAHMAMLDEDQKNFIQKLWTDYNYEFDKNTIHPSDDYYTAIDPPQLTYEGYIEKNLCVPQVLQEGGSCYITLNGHKIYLPMNKEKAEDYIRDAYLNFAAADSPHTYLRPQDDGIDVPEGAIIADVGAAEGFFGIKHLDRCKKVYFFEYDYKWLRALRKTCAPHGGKVEIIEGIVGDQPGNIRLDEFFARRNEKPGLIKMDIEGAEGRALRGMAGLLADAFPLVLLICTYHRQEDWDNYYSMLHERFSINSSNGYYWHLANARPPFLRRGVMRAVKKTVT
ncbi:MAG: hypothetical protein FWF99_02045 [Desulfovibrionaceae bacterium]|nr:hypothetical protein [Desulfovibrionaceae bacterium]